MRTDIEIAQAAKLLPIGEVAARVGIDGKYLEQYGRHKAKVDLSYLDAPTAPDGASSADESRPAEGAVKTDRTVVIRQQSFFLF